MAAPARVSLPPPDPSILSAGGTVDCENAVGYSCQLRFPPTDQQPQTLDKWWDDLQAFKERKRTELGANVPGGDFAAYANKDVAWARQNFIQPQVMVHDRFLYDRVVGEWTVAK